MGGEGHGHADGRVRGAEARRRSRAGGQAGTRAHRHTGRRAGCRRQSKGLLPGPKIQPPVGERAEAPPRIQTPPYSRLVSCVPKASGK